MKSSEQGLDVSRESSRKEKREEHEASDVGERERTGEKKKSDKTKPGVLSIVASHDGWRSYPEVSQLQWFVCGLNPSVPPEMASLAEIGNLVSGGIERSKRIHDRSAHDGYCAASCPQYSIHHRSRWLRHLASRRWRPLFALHLRPGRRGLQPP